MLSRFRGLLVRERPSLDRVVAGKRTVKLGKRSYITGQYFHNFSSRFIFLLLFFFQFPRNRLAPVNFISKRARPALSRRSLYQVP